ncbi:sporadically distributed protein, TIGR04141 family [Actinokineospora alba]|uniref:Sporadically distributed protein, TIGR04141 family n=1 Tax=Actinokineospora alba TaxID=504798 RepID=A0A1H0QR76_9PSEU|nr:DUF6119 family protein [Actinokineospora alba]TDP70453.1 uncharacterized protein (TIGR04141 family) [Actinokineospora alba]SDI31282.1 sporadically distributed protein, TIGR04141 family [Actinokineospora alba]SDP19249.1 sporadically distributed protein, TIGR04141 family [Actinokineospora alba]
MESHAPAPESTRTANLYRLRTDVAFANCWARPKDSAADTYVAEPVDALGDEAMLVAGSPAPTRVAWVPLIAGLTGTSLDFWGGQSSAILFVRVGSNAFALTFGGGWRMLRSSAIDHDFGLNLALRVLDSAAVRTISRTYFSSKARVDRNTVPGGTSLWSFGIREHAELVGQIAGRIRSPESLRISQVRKTERRITIDCTTRVRLPIPSDRANLIDDLREISRVLGSAPSPDLEPLTWISRVPSDADFLPEAWAQVGRDLRDHADSVSIAYPSAYHAGPDIVTYRGKVGQNAIDTRELTLADIRDGLVGKDTDAYTHVLKSGHITGYSEEDHPLGDDVNALHWLTAQVDLADGKRLVLLDGHWYDLTDRYRGYVDRVIDAAFRPDPPWRLPDWRETADTAATRDEQAYNLHVGTLEGFLCLDRNLLRPTGRQGFEACDLLGPNQELIHVKRVSSRTGSGPLSHLFAQGIVAVENLVEKSTWDMFVDRVTELDPSRAKALGDRPSAVVYAIHRGDRPLSKDSLFSFAKAELASATMIFQRLGIPMWISVIP